MRRKALAVLIGLVVLTAGMNSAQAIPVLSLLDPANPLSLVTVPDGGLGDINAFPGVVTYNGPVGANWVLSVTTGVTKPFAPSTPLNPEIDMNSISATSLGAGTLWLMFSEDSFLASPIAFEANIGGTTSGTVTYNAYLDPANAIWALPAVPAVGLQLTGIGPLVGPGKFGGTATSNVNVLVAPYSLTEYVMVTHNTVGNSSFDAELVPVPEPSTLLLLGTGFLGLASLGVLRRRM